MKKILNILIVFMFVTISLLSNSINVEMASTIGISGPNSTNVGSTFKITISGNSNTSYDLKIDYDRSKLEFVTSSENCYGLTCSLIARSQSTATITFRAISTGPAPANISVSGYGSVVSGDDNEFAVSGSKSITVNPKPTTNRPSTPSVDNNNDKYPSKEELEQRELEARKLVPLVSSFEVVSTSDKRNGEVLTTVESQKEQFEYTYKLPKRIDKFKINLTPTAENVTITGDLEHVFNEGDDPVKTITYTLKDDKIEQTYVIKIEKNTEEMIPVTVDEIGYKIYDDDLLDAYMEGLGFTKTGYPIDENVSSSYFLLESIRLQLLIDNENNAFWYLLDVDNKPVARTVMLSDSKRNIIFVLEANEELAKERIYDNSYQQHNVTLDEGLLKVDNNLNFEQSVMAWQWDENLAVYARGIDGVDDTYAIKDGMIKTAVMAFDKTSVMWQYAAIGFGILSVLLAVTLVAYMVKERRWKKKHLSSRDIRRKLADKEIDHSVELVDKTE